MKRSVALKRFQSLLDVLRDTGNYASKKWPELKEDLDTSVECIEDVIESLKNA